VNYLVLRMITILLPTLMIGGFEYFRHNVLADYMSMEAGNFYMTLLTFVLFYIFANWMFRHIAQSNARLAQEQARRAVYEERERLANELHDNIAQTLFFLNVKLQKGYLDEAKSAVADINHQVRQAIFNLRSSPDEGTDFMERIHLWLEEWSLITGIAVRKELHIESNYFSPVEEVNLFGIIQEAFTNIRKHSQADTATISFLIEEGAWILRIKDNGCGIQTDVLDQNKYGMLMMKRRSDELQARLECLLAANGGTELTVTGRKELLE
jgi:signal transduction histidine kinase